MIRTIQWITVSVLVVLGIVGQPLALTQGADRGSGRSIEIAIRLQGFSLRPLFGQIDPRNCEGKLAFDVGTAGRHNVETLGYKFIIRPEKNDLTVLRLRWSGTTADRDLLVRNGSARCAPDWDDSFTVQASYQDRTYKS